MIGSPADAVQALRDRKTIAKEVTNILRWRIIRGDLAAGERVGEEKVARELGVSRGPVRESLRELENEGLLVVEAYRGAVVVEVSAAELKGVLLPVRHVIEQHVVENALADLSDRDYAALEAIAQEMARVVAGGGDDLMQLMVELDVAFHSYIIDTHGDFHSRQLWASIAPRVRAGFYKLGALHSHPGAIAAEHDELLAALRTHDLTIALEALSEHVLASPIRLLESVEGGVDDGDV